MMYYIEVRNYRGTVEYETQVSGYETLVKRITAIMRNYFYAIDVFTMEPFARMGGSSYRGWTTEDRKVHGATIKYGRAESGPLASRLNESLDLNRDFDAERVYTDAEIFASWLIDSEMIFSNLTARQWEGPNFGALRVAGRNKLLFVENFHIFEEPNPELLEGYADGIIPFEIVAEEGLDAMAGNVSGVLLDMVAKAARETGSEDWLEEDMVVIANFSDSVSEDEVTLIFPDNSEINMILWGPEEERKVLRTDSDVWGENLILSWKTGFKIIDAGGKSIGSL
tara:strand:+ start:17 stop:862 length:846 start_codon:yes stop_codon:yes gene_type:complete